MQRETTGGIYDTERRAETQDACWNCPCLSCEAIDHDEDFYAEAWGIEDLLLLGGKTGIRRAFRCEDGARPFATGSGLSQCFLRGKG